MEALCFGGREGGREGGRKNGFGFVLVLCLCLGECCLSFEEEQQF